MDDEGIRDIADVVETDKGLYNENEVSLLNSSSQAVLVQGKDQIKLDEEELSYLQKSSDRRAKEEDDDLSRAM